MKRILLSYFLFLSFSIIAQTPYKIIAYYTGNGEAIRQWPVDKLTHIIFSFLKVQNDTLGFRNEKQENSLRQLVELKKKLSAIKNYGVHRRMGRLCILQRNVCF